MRPPVHSIKYGLPVENMVVLQPVRTEYERVRNPKRIQPV